MSARTIRRATARHLALCESTPDVAELPHLAECGRRACRNAGQWRVAVQGGPARVLCTKDAARRVRRPEAIQHARRRREWAALTEAAAQVVRCYTFLPEIAGVSVGSSRMGGQQQRMCAQLQLAAYQDLRSMARWAHAFRAPVKIIPHAAFVEVTTETRFDNHLVLVWDHFEQDLVWLCGRLGVPVPEQDGVLEVWPDELAAAWVSGRGR